jgi:hypothetical protein
MKYYYVVFDSPVGVGSCTLTTENEQCLLFGQATEDIKKHTELEAVVITNIIPINEEQYQEYFKYKNQIIQL